MSPDGGEKAAVVRSGPAVVQEEDALARSPKRRGAKLIGSGRALADVIGQPRAHVMYEHVGEEVRVLEIERGIQRRRCGRQRRRVAHVAVYVAELGPAVGNGRW